MINKKIGVVTTEEKEKILVLYERRLALHELAITLNNPEFDENSKNELYERILVDLSKTKVDFDRWWEKKGEKYQWKLIEGYQWSINFKTCEIFAVEKNKCSC
ncbi:CXXX repeat peptide modification system protein [Clostridium tagluense]|uniref:CXXX repeat peptide modification system protein n=1 Tax=Clostridium tagluense TaxID=360422 RepID=UPI001C0AD94C|nr:CXXX repeat peptide modification system protein [Clostridium tagluense]MBU3130689.1 CXXX repeat peptide modification system protein [Clostridium tagluense]